MIINGSLIAQTIAVSLEKRVTDLKSKNIQPTLVIILVGENPASISYINQKIKKAKKIGIAVLLDRKPADITTKQLRATINNYNRSPDVHGIIVQLPLPNHLSEEIVTQAVSSEKDVDGFKENSSYLDPIVKALFYIFQSLISGKPNININLEEIKKWLRDKKIVVIGKGKTAGKPIIQELTRLKLDVNSVDQKTPNPQQLIKKGDIVISAVGKKQIVNRDNLKPKAILIGIGLHEENGHLKGDYKEEEIKDITSFFTPTPKGIGPINVISLLENVVLACEILHFNK